MIKINQKILITIGILAFLILALSVDAIPNPAAVYCNDQGYKGDIRTDPTGGQYGVCIFPDGTECSDWDYYCKCASDSNMCPPGDYSCDFPCKEMACKKAGESVLVSKCCEGLKKISPVIIYDEECQEKGMVGWTHICSDCGNGICESWENKCNCSSDCAGIKQIVDRIYYIIGLIVIFLIYFLIKKKNNMRKKGIRNFLQP